MTNISQSDERTKYVQGLFSRIAKRYRLMNAIMSFGFDQHWRDEAVKILDIRSDDLVLDVGSGTGDIAYCILNHDPKIHVIAVDNNPDMIANARCRPAGNQITWVIADAGYLPFQRESFSRIISGFLLRNVSNLDLALSEQCRIGKPGSKYVILETTPIVKGIFKPLILFYLNLIIPLMGEIVAQNREAYTYLPNSTMHFLTAEMLSARLSLMGLILTGCKRFMLGGIAIHWGQKPL